MIVKVLDLLGNQALVNLQNIDVAFRRSPDDADGMSTWELWSSGRKHTVVIHTERAQNLVAASQPSGLQDLTKPLPEPEA